MEPILNGCGLIKRYGKVTACVAGIETVCQTLAMLPNLSIADSMFMGRELRKPEGQRRPFGSKVFILNEPTTALGVKGSRKVLELLQI